EKKVTFQDECKNEASKDQKADQSKQEGQTAEGNGPAPGVLTWISGALPQPVSPKLSRANSTTKEETTTASKPEEEKGMIAWIAQGLEKVVPQPDLKNKESTPAELPAEPAASSAPVSQAAAAPAAEPPVTAPTAEVKPEEKTDNKTQPPSMMEWIKHGIEKVVPQESAQRQRATKRQKLRLQLKLMFHPQLPQLLQLLQQPHQPQKPPQHQNLKLRSLPKKQSSSPMWLGGSSVRSVVFYLSLYRDRTQASDEVQSRGKGGEPLKIKGEGRVGKSRSH
ncbi:cyclic nucleotide-gated cation channel beta-1, partial [Lates japonicus]